MKPSLGKVILLCMSVFMLQAEDFKYHFHVDNNTPYVKEAVILTLDLNQTNPDVVLLFNFDLVPSDTYAFQRLDSKETDSYHNAQVQYVYLVYPLVSKEVNIQFRLTKKVTTDESVAYSFSGDRDNVKGLVTTNTNIALNPLTLMPRALPKGTQIVGDFRLEYKIKKHQAQAYEPLPLQVNIKGLGYPPLLTTLLQKEGNFTQFTETPIVHSVTSTQGTQSTVIYPIALSHDKKFTLDTIVIKAFNPLSERSYELTVPTQHFDIKQVDKSQLLDATNTPESLATDFSWIEWLGTALKYLMIFMAGYFSALTFRWRKRKKVLQDNPLKEKIKSTKNERTLLQILLSTDSKRFETSIEKLESFLYANGKINFKKVKKEAEEQV